jgi:hypothetical protein
MNAAAQSISVRPQNFLADWVYDNAALDGRRELFARWFTDPTPREEIAERLRISLGALLRSLNDTAPLQPPLPFGYRGVGFEVVAMAGVCDDVADGRFPLFGAPITLRCYMQAPAPLPQRMFEAADWNYMDAGRPGFVGYAYGVHHGATLYLAGLQSDLAVRYTYLFQGRGAYSQVRRGDKVVELPARLRQEPVELVRSLRRTFQRTWIEILLGAVLTWAAAKDEITQVGLLQFPMTAEEDVRGTVVHRVYRALAAKLGAVPATVCVGARRHEYAVATTAAVREHLGAAFTA